jgi:hypothetical protein
MPENADNSSLLKRYLALKTLRENVFLNHPTAYNFLDVAEDLPGGSRAVAPFLADVLPSAVLLNKSPEALKSELVTARSRVEQLEKNKAALKSQVLQNALSMGLGGIPAGATLSGLFSLLGKKPSLSRVGKNISKLKNSSRYRKALGSRMAHDAAKGGTMAAISGASIPLVAANAKFSKDDLDQASALIQKYPISSSLPAGELIGAMNMGEKEVSPLRNTALGLTAGAVMGAAGTFIPPALDTPTEIIRAVKSKKSPVTPIKNLFARAARKGLLRNTALLSGLGGLAGYTLSRNKTHYDDSTKATT